jgi:hypothetical protein
VAAALGLVRERTLRGGARNLLLGHTGRSGVIVAVVAALPGFRTAHGDIFIQRILRLAGEGELEIGTLDIGDRIDGIAIRTS